MQTRKRVSACTVICILFLGVVVASSPGAIAQQTSESAQPVGEVPDSPGALLSKSQPAAVQQGSSAQLTSTPLLNLPSAGLSSARQDQATAPSPAREDQRTEIAQVQAQAQSDPSAQPPDQKPVGTAAAGSIPVTGIAASEPSGVAIAPAKQRRVRTIVLKLGAIIAAGVAVGTVVALTEATSSRPPGAH